MCPKGKQTLRLQKKQFGGDVKRRCRGLYSLQFRRVLSRGGYAVMAWSCTVAAATARESQEGFPIVRCRSKYCNPDPNIIGMAVLSPSVLFALPDWTVLTTAYTITYMVYY